MFFMVESRAFSPNHSHLLVSPPSSIKNQYYRKSYTINKASKANNQNNKKNINKSKQSSSSVLDNRNNKDESNDWSSRKGDSESIERRNQLRIEAGRKEFRFKKLSDEERIARGIARKIRKDKAGKKPLENYSRNIKRLNLQMKRRRAQGTKFGKTLQNYKTQ